MQQRCAGMWRWRSITTDSAARLRLCLTRPAASANRSSLFSFFCLLSGRGDVKLLQNKDTKLVRVLLRQEKTLKLCMNHKGQATHRDDRSHRPPPAAVAVNRFLRLMSSAVTEPNLTSSVPSVCPHALCFPLLSAPRARACSQRRLGPQLDVAHGRLLDRRRRQADLRAAIQGRGEYDTADRENAE